MPVLKRIARKLLRRKAGCPYPVTSRDYFPSMIFSADDDVGPSPRLMELALAAVQLAAREVTLEDLSARENVPNWFSVWPGEHYRLLGALMLVLRPKVVVEIGTFTGLSALAMKKYLPAEGKIVSFDLRAWDTIPETVLRAEDFADERLEQRLENLAEAEAIARNRELLESAEFFFIDAPKDNVFEYKLVEHLETLRLARRPILMFDDTRLWSMLRFWRMLKHPKMDLTSFGSWSGTGLVDWNGSDGDGNRR